NRKKSQRIGPRAASRCRRVWLGETAEKPQRQVEQNESHLLPAQLFSARRCGRQRLTNPRQPAQRRCRAVQPPAERLEAEGSPPFGSTYLPLWDQMLTGSRFGWPRVKPAPVSEKCPSSLRGPGSSPSQLQ